MARDEALTSTKRGWNGGEKRREVVYSFQPTRHGERQGIESNDTQENMSAQLLVGYHYLGALDALRHP